MPSAAIGAKVNKTLDIHRNFTTTITFNDEISFNDFSDPGNIVTTQIIRIHLVGQIRLIQNLPRRSQANTINIGKGAINMFTSR